MTDPQRKIKEWLAAKLSVHGALKAAGEATGMSKDQLGRSKEIESDDPKKRRMLKPDEIQKLARHFKELPPGYEQMTTWLGPETSEERVARIVRDVKSLEGAERDRLAARIIEILVSEKSQLQLDPDASPEAGE